MKILAIIKDKEIISASEFDGNAEITSEESSIFIDTPENLLLILNAIGVQDTSKIEFFKSNHNEEI